MGSEASAGRAWREPFMTRKCRRTTRLRDDICRRRRKRAAAAFHRPDPGTECDSAPRWIPLLDRAKRI